MRFAIVDIETTGGSPTYHRIVEIGIVILENGKQVQTFQTLLNPGRTIPPQVVAIHGITESMVADAPLFEEVALEIASLLADTVFVAHAVNFDYGFVKAEMNRAMVPFELKRICTVRLSKKLLPHLPGHSLAALCKYLSIHNERAHRALEDAHATALVWGYLSKLPDFELLVKGFLSPKSREMSLPPHVDKNAFLALPEQTGVYLFHDQHGKVLYVGKANNIKDRVSQHFSGSTHTKAKSTFLNSIFDVSYQLAGSEIMALLLENELIKQHYPRFNSNNKEFTLNYGMFMYEDQAGYQHLQVAECGKWTKPITVFKSRHEGVNNLLKTSMEYGLCLRLNGLLDTRTGKCNYTTVSGKRCMVCADQMLPEDYNKVVEGLILSELKGDSFLLRTKGRCLGEVGVVWVDAGKLKGYGYIPNDQSLCRLEDLVPFMKCYYDTRDAQGTLKLYLNKTRRVGELPGSVAVLELD